jgi:hypothetical protein
VGVGRTPFVGDPVHERMPPGFNKPEMTDVATYVIETDDRRYYLQAAVASSDGFVRYLTIGDSVRFAVEKKTAYIKLEQASTGCLWSRMSRRSHGEIADRFRRQTFSGPVGQLRVKRRIACQDQRIYL